MRRDKETRAKVHSPGVLKRIANLRKGMGSGKKAGFGQIHHSRLAKPFKKSLQRVMARYPLPIGNVVTESRTEAILQELKSEVQSRFGRAYEEASEEDWPNKMSRPSLMDNARTLVTGTFVGSIIPNYIRDAIFELEDDRWKRFWITALLVKQNHFAYQKARDKKGADPDFKLMDLDGTCPEDKEVIHRPPEFFKNILIQTVDSADVVTLQTEKEGRIRRAKQNEGYVPLDNDKCKRSCKGLHVQEKEQVQANQQEPSTLR